MNSSLVCLIALCAAALVACGETPAPDNDSVDTGYHQTPLVTDTQPDTLLYRDTSLMVVDSTSHITFNGQPLDLAQNGIYNAVYHSWLND